MLDDCITTILPLDVSYDCNNELPYNILKHAWALIKKSEKSQNITVTKHEYFLLLLCIIDEKLENFWQFTILTLEFYDNIAHLTSKKIFCKQK